MSSSAIQVDFSDNYFELFQCPVAFEIDKSLLLENYRVLQKQLHPDRFAAAPETQRRWSVQAASFVNDGYQTLENDLRRAGYLLQLNKIDIDEETDTRMAPAFLMEQMELRESLESAEQAADPVKALDALRDSVRAGVKVQMDNFKTAISETNWTTARDTARQWQFLDKLLREVKQMEERLDI